MNRQLIHKYLHFLADFSDQLVSQHSLAKPELESLDKEFKRFVQAISADPTIDPRFLEKLTSIQLNPKKNPRRSTGDKLIKLLTLRSRGSLDAELVNAELAETDTRDVIREFRDRMSHLLYAIDTYQLPE